MGITSEFETEIRFLPKNLERKKIYKQGRKYPQSQYPWLLPQLLFPLPFCSYLFMLSHSTSRLKRFAPYLLIDRDQSPLLEKLLLPSPLLLPLHPQSFLCSDRFWKVADLGLFSSNFLFEFFISKFLVNIFRFSVELVCVLG